MKLRLLVQQMAVNINPHPDEILARLKAGAKSLRTVKSLDLIHLACREQFERGSRDFSYSMIGQLSENAGGPKAQPIRNKSGAVYRTLIDAWACLADKKSSPSEKLKPSRLEDDVLSMINDSVARILVQTYISENRKRKNENQVLKRIAKDNVVISLYDRQNTPLNETATHTASLLEQELDALRDALSSETMRRHGWSTNVENGAVTKGPFIVFKPGFATAIKKILLTFGAG